MNRTPDESGDGKRRWLAISLATLIMLFSYGLFLFAFSVSSGNEAVFAGGILGIALGLVPGVFIAAALVTRHPKTLRTTALATLLWAAFTIPIGIFDLPTGLVAGFGAGGVVALRRGPAHTWESRSLAVAACVAYTFMLQRLSPEAGIFGGAVLPFIAIGIADVTKERSADKMDSEAPNP